MNDFISFFMILIVITIFYTYLESKAVEVAYVKSNIDKRNYLVRKMSDMQQAADLLSILNTNLKSLIKHIVEKINTDSSYTPQIITDIKRLNSNYNEEHISESSPGNTYTSYSINKGEKIVFCLRSKDEAKKLIDLNTLTFVAIHELAHLMTKSIGHEPEFWENMKFLLKEGISIDIYKKQDFNSNPVEYCGMKITDTPLK